MGHICAIQRIDVTSATGSTTPRSEKAHAATDPRRRPQAHRTRPGQPMVTRNPAVAPNPKTAETSAGTVGSRGGILLQTAKAVALSLTKPSTTKSVSPRRRDSAVFHPRRGTAEIELDTYGTRAIDDKSIRRSSRCRATTSRRR